LNVDVVVDVETEVWLTVEEEGAAVTLNFKHRPLTLRAIEAVAVDLDAAAVVQPKWRFSREKLRHAIWVRPKTDR
jgi:hypothetical protein